MRLTTFICLPLIQFATKITHKNSCKINFVAVSVSVSVLAIGSPVGIWHLSSLIRLIYTDGQMNYTICELWALLQLLEFWKINCVQLIKCLIDSVKAKTIIK